jgi:hypothetical protein
VAALPVVLAGTSQLCWLKVEKLTAAALDGKILKLTALVSANLVVKLVWGHTQLLADSCLCCSEAAVLA